ncbi:Rz-like lysis system protein LysB [Collimonas sp.]|jgi:LysB family phage lysis regulatory protein|uniref:Rz-like lysis system protein LysB n=1 Tax=Collimonas sp. TaxID=1963772 RepID=UPI002D1A1822|nr:Rz-like lysis system protein LysB [Collimonas sp.]HWX02506.1 Rz-like lysis system protein LysB [Collimonas sp.]
MELIVKSLISALAVGALCLVIYVQRDGLTAARERAETAEQITRDRDGTIKTLTDAAARDKKAAAKLQAARDNIAATLTERENLIERLQHDDPQVRNWADTPLPDAVARLREHPAATGADAYSQRLPSDHALSVAGGGAQN